MVNQIEYGTTGKPHPYHIVRPSIWPLASSFAGMFLAIGAVLFMHDVKIGDYPIGIPSLIFGILSILVCMFFWWKDVIYEAYVEKIHTPIAQIGLRYGMLLFIASEVMFFVAFFWAFFDASLYADEAVQVSRVEHTGGQWPPPQIEVINALDLPLMMTMILLLSGSAVTWAHHAILEGHKEDFVKALGVTVGLGVFFLCFQIYEYTHVTFGFTEGIYPSVFYMATGFHGFHVFVGTVFLAVCWIRAAKGHFTKDNHFGFEAAAWYWHFVDVVWLFLFIAVYWWGSLGAQ
ncbi:MAG: cytochrome c oxidase subunit 3 [Pseudomonadota bacterium]